MQFSVLIFYTFYTFPSSPPFRNYLYIPLNLILFTTDLNLNIFAHHLKSNGNHNEQCRYILRLSACTFWKRILLPLLLLYLLFSSTSPPAGLVRNGNRTENSQRIEKTFYAYAKQRFHFRVFCSTNSRSRLFGTHSHRISCFSYGYINMFTLSPSLSHPSCVLWMRFCPIPTDVLVVVRWKQSIFVGLYSLPLALSLYLAMRPLCVRMLPLLYLL